MKRKTRDFSALIANTLSRITAGELSCTRGAPASQECDRTCVTLIRSDELTVKSLDKTKRTCMYVSMSQISKMFLLKLAYTDYQISTGLKYKVFFVGYNCNEIVFCWTPDIFNSGTKCACSVAGPYLRGE